MSLTNCQHIRIHASIIAARAGLVGNQVNDLPDIIEAKSLVK